MAGVAVVSPMSGLLPELLLDVSMETFCMIECAGNCSFVADLNTFQDDDGKLLEKMGAEFLCGVVRIVREGLAFMGRH